MRFYPFNKFAIDKAAEILVKFGNKRILRNFLNEEIKLFDLFIFVSLKKI